jgi:putative PIN family toxin of toxin-antitoxin system
MRVVLDTNVLVRVVVSPSGPAAALFNALRGPHAIIVSDDLLSEFTDTLMIPWARAAHQFSDAEIEVLVQDFRQKCDVATVPLRDAVPAVSVDRDDDSVIATAIAGRADVLCSRDKHLRAANVIEYLTSHGIEVLDDVELLTKLRAIQP